MTSSVDNRTKVVVETVRRLELLEELNELGGAEEVIVFGGNLYDYGDVLSEVQLYNAEVSKSISRIARCLHAVAG
jgi:hypothetical protein